MGYPIKGLRQRTDALVAELQRSRASVRHEKRLLIKAAEQLACTTEAQEFLQSVAQSVQNKAHEKVATIVSRCLRSVFENPYTFRIEFLRKRGKTEARLIFERDGKEFDPTEECGGGVVDVAAFALRIARLLLARPPLRRLLILDEPFRFVSVNHRPQVRQMVEELSKELGIQFIIITHDKEFQIGKVIELGAP